MSTVYENDRIIFAPGDVDLRLSPLRGSLLEATFVLGAFNPGLTVLPSGNLLMMVRIAEALAHPIKENNVRALRWDEDLGYVTDEYPLESVDASDPRKFHFLEGPSKVMALTSLSWLLPVELSSGGERIERVHYDKVIQPQAGFQEYGIEDPRISRVDGTYYMTTCSVSAERHSTVLYTSIDGINYSMRGIILDHQNKDMVIFEGKSAGKFHALTRPMGELYFAYPSRSPHAPGPSINLASSPDALHWKPADKPFIRPRKLSASAVKVGGGTPPILTDRGWLMVYHGVEEGGTVGIYRTFWALLDPEDPSVLLEVHDDAPLLESRSELTSDIPNPYLTDVVFSTGIVELEHEYLIASGENDLACRLTRIPKSTFKPTK
ncbi:hypothetical protein JIN84_21740 [Luteolibacter yonseiensis]|uniref:Glycosidase n=1 Tax=Luteolibacter yonseiensis TaxID=1144680 RepID=A0A934VE52_9BACT|nr:hypothetical protein [Luteolibacter yonseiensis]MBK1818259.1 hypothetical protein [Luteolibacter yonseiensis]